MILTLLVGLLAAQLLGAVILLRDRASALYEASGLSASQRIAGTVHALDRLDAETRNAIVPALNSAQLRVSLDPRPLAAQPLDNTHAEHLRALLQRLLGDERPLRVLLLTPERAEEQARR